VHPGDTLAELDNRAVKLVPDGDTRRHAKILARDIGM
jgi:hypothetical protein